MEINKYPDSSSYVTLNEYYTSDWITFKINTYNDLWYLNQFVNAFNFKFKKKPFILIPNLIDAQADRRFNDNESSGLKLVCKFLNGMKANFKIFHPHNPEVVEALIDDVEIIDNSGFIMDVIGNRIPGTIIGKSGTSDRYFGGDNLILMSSDAGGFKPLMKVCDTINWQGQTVSASKSRTYKDGKSHLTQILNVDDFGGKDILIIDDISVYGGTFKGLSKLLKERNCGKLYLAVSHMTVQNLGEDPVTNYFDKVFTTNSKFDTYFNHPTKPRYGDDLIVPKNLEIIKMF